MHLFPQFLKGCGGNADFKDKLGTTDYDRDGGITEKVCKDDGCNKDMDEVNKAGTAQATFGLYLSILLLHLYYLL